MNSIISGKSSLTLALFRVFKQTSGRIMIDGIDISSLSLHELRSKLTIIPQDPTLFTGSLRFNLDPFDQYSDQQLIDSLSEVHLSSFYSQLSDGLSHQIESNGENMSAGQKQLIYLARTLLRETKILILDEATANIDNQTDSYIQSVIKKHFKNCTILTIAHRLNTVINCDRIIVLSHGSIVESGKPQHLLSDKNSIFYNFLEETKSF
jgi:ABC-type multidrug transport system fused ATPase/permease subunit